MSPRLMVILNVDGVLYCAFHCAAILELGEHALHDVKGHITICRLKTNAPETVKAEIICDLQAHVRQLEEHEFQCGAAQPLDFDAKVGPGLDARGV